MKLDALKAPFLEEEIEWRLAQCGVKGNGQIWGICLAYVSARAIMNRLDEVCGPENWRVDYSFVNISDEMDPGVMCRLSIKVGDAWVTKEDGAEQTDIEPFKGGLSSALKRAGSVWGIGRYLYQLESGFATIVDKKTKEAKYGKTKDGKEFYWVPPALPAWALPVGEIPKPSLPKIFPEQPAFNDGFPANYWMIPFGHLKGKKLEEVDFKELAAEVNRIEDEALAKGKEIQGIVKEFIDRATKRITQVESQDFENFKEPNHVGK